MTRTIRLPRPDGTIEAYEFGRVPPVRPGSGRIESRVACAAAHVVADPLADTDPTSAARLDWDATLAYRRYLWSLGLGVAEAMDTAQRGMGLGWPEARELIRRTLAEARAVERAGGFASVVSGAGTDHLEPSPRVTLADVRAAYEEQVGFVEGEGGRVVLMASRALAACAKGPDDYAEVYGAILRQVRRPVLIHWLGDMFDPQLEGYWGARDLDRAMASCLAIVREHAARIDGIKISLLDKAREIAMRRLLPEGVRMYTGDDFDYPELIRGDGERASDALLGIFDAIAPAASAALRALDAGDLARFETILAPTVPLSRHVFRAPTRFYKTGVVFIAYLNGHQRHFRMVGGQESARSIVHLAEVFRLADRAGLLADPDRAAARMRPVLALAGVE
ncbi:MAG TPA: dihydrodipicolinate synthase family protein [Thermodesulfobacteriota bacterium]